MARIGIRAKIGVGYGYKKGGLASIDLPYQGRVKIGEEIQFFRGVKWKRGRTGEQHGNLGGLECAMIFAKQGRLGGILSDLAVDISENA